MKEFEIGDCVCSIIVGTMIGTVKSIIDDNTMMVAVTSNNVFGVKTICADMNYWRKIKRS